MSNLVSALDTIRMTGEEARRRREYEKARDNQIAQVVQAMHVPLKGGEMVSSCNCVGPKNGQPLCPCRMRGVIERDGRYILPERDLGPVR